LLYQTGDISLLRGNEDCEHVNKLRFGSNLFLKEDLSPDDILLKIIELEENIVRVDLTWQEKAEALASLHQAYQGLGWGKHTVEDTADRIGKSKAYVSEEVELAIWAKEIPEISGTKKKSDAKKMVKRLKEEIKRSELLEGLLSKEHDTTIQLDEKGKIEKQLQEYDQKILLGTMEERLNDIPGLFDIVLFDPPWGVEFDQCKLRAGITTKNYEDSKPAFEASLEPWFKLIYEKMNPDAHLYMFFAMKNYPLVYELAHKTGFSTNGIPLIWHKKGAHHTRNPDVWHGRCYEPILFARKGNKKLQILGAPDIIVTPMPTPKIKQDHPSAKHPDIYKEIIQRSALPGNRILDPMGGSGMSMIACESLRASHFLDWWMIEMDSTFRDLALFNLYKGYTKIVNDYDAPPPKKGSFKELEPGTAEWITYWDAYPDEQEEMLKWKKEKLQD